MVDAFAKVTRKILLRQRAGLFMNVWHQQECQGSYVDNTISGGKREKKKEKWI